LTRTLWCSSYFWIESVYKDANEAFECTVGTPVKEPFSVFCDTTTTSIGENLRRSTENDEFRFCMARLQLAPSTINFVREILCRSLNGIQAL
jgi:hypothetical protein